MSRETVVRGLAAAAIRLCRSSPNPDFEAGLFFASVGEAMARDSRLLADPWLYERCETSLRAAFYMGQLGPKLTEDDRRILRRWTN